VGCAPLQIRVLRHGLLTPSSVGSTNRPTKVPELIGPGTDSDFLSQ
jgi:hypothetical protein